MRHIVRISSASIKTSSFIVWRPFNFALFTFISFSFYIKIPNELFLDILKKAKGKCLQVGLSMRWFEQKKKARSSWFSRQTCRQYWF